RGFRSSRAGHPGSVVASARMLRAAGHRSGGLGPGWGSGPPAGGPAPHGGRRSTGRKRPDGAEAPAGAPFFPRGSRRQHKPGLATRKGFRETNSGPPQAPGPDFFHGPLHCAPPGTPALRAFLAKRTGRGYTPHGTPVPPPTSGNDHTRPPERLAHHHR